MASVQASPIYSTLSDDPDMLELVEEFVEALHERVESLQGAAAEGDLENVRRLAHQLKGAAGGYGFDVIGQSAATLEASCKEARQVQQVTNEMNQLIDFCRRASADPPA